MIERVARLLYGADRADSGSISIHGEPARIATPRHAIEHRMVFSSEDRRGEGEEGVWHGGSLGLGRAAG